FPSPSIAVSENLSRATLPGGPLSDCPVNVSTWLTLSRSLRPCMIGWSPMWSLSRRKCNPSADSFARSDATRRLISTPTCFPISRPDRFPHRGGAHPNGSWAGADPHAPARPDPLPNRFAFRLTERGCRRLGIVWAGAPPAAHRGIGDDQEVVTRQALIREEVL